MQRILVTLLGLLLTGCAYSSFTPNYDQQFGQAVRAARLAQTLDPAAGSQPPIMGLEGTNAAHTMERYERTFRLPPPVVNVINIGGQIGGTAPGGDGR